MSITYINRLTGASNNIVYVETSDSTATATASGYVSAQAANIAAVNEGAWTWDANDCIMLSASDGISWCSINSTFTTFSALGALSPVVDVTTLASATPGTVRALTGKVVDSVLMTSGNIVGVRGEADYVGASGGFIYGVQGKIIPTGALTGSEWSAGVFGQLDVNAATINGGQISAVWGDWGATGATATSMTGARGFAFTNTTSNILNAQFYMYGPATNLFELDDNSAGYGASYFVAAGTSSGSAGYASGCNASKVLHITMNGTAYWIPLFAQNS